MADGDKKKPPPKSLSKPLSKPLRDPGKRVKSTDNTPKRNT